ncbi:hypothetical protein ACFL5K_00245, partial [Gemmatimonadota bacterium]
GDLMTGLVVHSSPTDTDGDGMMDSWERANGLNPSDSADHNMIMDSGYTAIEEYCNELARKIIDTRGEWPPLRYDFSGDFKLNVADVISCIILGCVDSADPQLDIDGNGRYSIIDAITLLLMIRDL